MKQPIPLCALILVIGFFLPWISVTGGSFSGLFFARSGWPPGVWLWLIPGLALFPIFLSLKGKPIPMRLAAFVAGAYPWGWLAYHFGQISKQGGKEAAQGAGQYLLAALNIGGFATLGCAAALIFLAIFSRPESQK